MATKRPNYIHSESFFDNDRWAAHDKVGELLARGVGQISISHEGDSYTVSWPEREPAAALPIPTGDVA